MKSIPHRPPMLMRAYSNLLHRIPVSSGLTPLSFNALTNWQFGRCDQPVAASLLNGIEITVDPNDHDGRVLYLFGTNDPKVHAVTQSLLRPGDRFLDVGANYSSIGLLAADRVGPTGHVHLFEPQPSVCERVAAAIVRAGIRNVSLHGVALMDRDGRMKMVRPRRHSGRATLIEGYGRAGWDSIMVEVRNIANLLPRLIGSAPFGAKLDVEGAEPYLMPRLLEQASLRFLIFEAAQNHRELWNLVRDSGLALFGLQRLLFRKEIRRVDSFEQLASFHDLVAIRLPADVETPARVNPYELGRRLQESRVGSQAVCTPAL